MISRSNIFIALAVWVTLLQGCTRKDDPQFANYINEPVKSQVRGLDPTISASDLYTGLVMGQIYEGLMQYAYLERPVKVEPLLSDGMPEISKGNLVYKFKIRKGIFFHDDPSFKATNGKGRELEAADFIYSWKRLADPAYHSDGFWIFDGKVKGITKWREDAIKIGKADYSKPIEGLSAPDKYTLVITLAKPFPQLLYVLTMTGAWALPHEAIENYGGEFQNHPVGTGPYKFRSWVRNSKIILDRNPNYHDDHYPTKGEPEDMNRGLLTDAGKKLPLNDGVIFWELVEDQPRWLNFRKGETDWVEIPKDSFDSAVKKDELIDEIKKQGVELQKWTEPDLTFDALNMEDPILGKNKYLRQAMMMARDSAAVIQKFYNGRAIIAQGPIPPEIAGYNPNFKNPLKVFNLVKAKELLKKAGYPDGKGLPEFVYDTYGGTTSRQLGEFFQHEMAQLGIKIKIHDNTWPEFMDKQKKRKSQMFGMAWSADYPDAENFLQLFYGPNGSPGPNASNYNNPEFNKLYEQTAVMQDGPARNAIYQKMVDIVAEDCPYIFDAHRKTYTLNNGWFKNFKRNLINLGYIKYYRIDQQAKKELKPKL